LTEPFCSNCLSKENVIFHKSKDVPVNSVLNLKTREQALKIPRGNISLGFCENCGFISNVAFDSTLLEYSSEYESTQSFSQTYNTFARRLAEQLIDRHNLHGKDLLEIGCGNGEFLTLLCELGDNRGIGFDPAYIEGRSEGRKETKTKFIKDFYSEKYTEDVADFVYCRMTLEHIHPTAHFTRMIRQSIGERVDTIVFFQVPDVTRVLRDCAFEDIYYEHCSYFSPGSLARLFRICGFDVLNLELDYDGQYVMIEAKPAEETYLAKIALEDDLNQLQSLVKDFPEKFQKKTSKWKDELMAIYSSGRRVVLWGSGSKGVAFLTTLNIINAVEYVVDINPYRHGTYMAGTGQKIVAPEFLKEYQPDFVIVMNAVYKDEISKDLNNMGLSPEILTL
jgi:SAM-dependent methyltransferase